MVDPSGLGGEGLPYQTLVLRTAESCVLYEDLGLGSDMLSVEVMSTRVVSSASLTFEKHFNACDPAWLPASLES